jgi:4-amino-4-deoxy-L-arabinose transferase-like glycosyltransferase
VPRLSPLGFPYVRWIAYLLILLAYLAALLIDVQEIDATQYAVMSRELLASGNFTQLWDRGQPYLDKPPLTFWMSALSYSVFGVSTFAYKFPSFLFALLAIYSTERLARLLYDVRTGQWAGLILASCQAFFLMNNDVKTDMYLIGGMCLAVWQLCAYTRGGPWWHVPVGFVGIGLAMLAKGPLGLVAPAMALGGDLLLRRDWRMIFRWQWLLGLPVLALILLPWTLGQYAQYGWEGVRFFYWTQSFGRVTGQSTWTNDATPFFFVHTMAWSFLPWTLLFVLAFGQRVFALFRGKMRLPTTEEGISITGFVLIFAALSFSRFKLPHYIFLTYPFASILVARLINSPRPDNRAAIRKGLVSFQFVLYGLGWLLVAVLSFWAFVLETPLLLNISLLLAGLGIAFLAWQAKEESIRLLWVTAAGFGLLHFLLHSSTYPALLAYQSSAKAGQYITAQQLPQDRLFAYRFGGRAMDFYAGRVIAPLPNLDSAKAALPQGPYIVYTDAEGVDNFHQLPAQLDTLASFPQFRINRLTLPFLNPNTRPSVVSRRYLLRVTAK